MRSFFAAFLSFGVLSATSAARAEPRTFPADLPRTLTDDPPARRLLVTDDDPARPNRGRSGMTYAGGAIFLAGYLPVAGVALISVGNLGYAAARLMMTFGFGCARTFWDDPQFDNPHDNSDLPAFCRADFGAVQLGIPVVGPFLFAASHPTDSIFNPHGNAFSPGIRAALYTSGFIQAVGVTMMLASTNAGRIAEKKLSGHAFRLAPMRARHALGMALTIDGW